VIGALASVALGEASSALFGLPNLLLSQAAKADQAGYTANSTNARYYYSDVTNPGMPGKSMTLAPPKCYVIAVYRTTSKIRPTKAASWCGNSTFKSAVGSSCSTSGSDFLDSLTLADPVPGVKADPTTVLTTKNVRVPDLYLEIGFNELGEVTAAATPAFKSITTASLTASIVLPRVDAMFYPSSLLAPSSTAMRSLAVGITASQVAAYPPSVEGTSEEKVTTNAAASSGLLNVNFTVTLNGIKPGDTVSALTPPLYPPQAFLIPGLNDTVTVSAAASVLTPQAIAMDRVPINLTINVHEIGDPSLFLAALAGATQSAGSDFSKALVSAVLPPPGTQTLGQLIQKNNATVTAAVGSYYKDLASFQKECGGPSLSTQDAEDAYLTPLWSQIQQDYQGISQLAGSFGVDLNITPPQRPACASVKGKK
jgi:hypothetical protein